MLRVVCGVLLKVEGYIAGVTNPMFQQHDTWWDLVCVLDLPNDVGYVYSPEEKKAEDAMGYPAGVHVSPKINTTTPAGMLSNQFIKGVISGIEHQLDEVSSSLV